MSLPTSFYVRDGDLFVPTALCIGPWSEAAQHGGPPSALLVGALERFGEGPDVWFLARFMNELVRPVPMAPLRVTVEPIALGRKVQRIAATLSAGDTLVARATALRIRRAPIDLPVPIEPRLPPPESAPLTPFNFFTVEVGYHRAIEVRIARGVWAQGPVTGWMRARVPLLAGEETSPWERVVTVADAESGLCPPLPPDRYAFPNPDLVVTLDREPAGEWIGLDVRSVARPHGAGIAESALHDVEGPIGRSVQTLVIEPRTR